MKSGCIFFRISIKTEFSKAIIKLGVVYSQNEHNNENQRKYLGRQLCEYYVLVFIKALYSLRN